MTVAGAAPPSSQINESEMDSKKTRLNLPPGMEMSLRLDSPAPAFSPGYSPVKTSSPSKTTYSDRFIPCRSSSRLQNFALVEMPSPAKEGGNDAYSRLLRSELFGAEVCSPSGQASPISPNKNLFRFKTDRSVPASPFHGSTSGNDVGVLGEVSTPPKAPRKIPKTPHKVRSRAQIHRRRRRKLN